MFIRKTMATEIELKYLLCSQNIVKKVNIREKIAEILSSEQLHFVQQTKHLANYYLDTPKLAFRQLDMGLRVRGTTLEEQSVQFEQTIKTAGKVIGGLHSRPEYNVDINSNKVDLALFPLEVWHNSGVNVDELQQDVASLFETHFTRTVWTIDFEKSVIELAFDQGNISCEGFDKIDAIFEIELELISGEQQALCDLASVLFASIAMRPGKKSKAARGYALAAECKSIEKGSDGFSAKTVMDSVDNTFTELQLEVIPMQKYSSVSHAFKNGIEHSLDLLQSTVDDYIYHPNLSKLIKTGEILALLRQGFWLFENELPQEYIALRKELSYFIRVINWADNAEHLQALVSKTGGYRKKIAHSDELIEKLHLEKNRYPDEQQIIHLFHSERFNLLQLSLLQLLLKENVIESIERQVNQTELLSFAKMKLDHSLAILTKEMNSLAIQPRDNICEAYMSSHGVLIRSLLAGSWFSTMFGDEQSNDMILCYRRPWLDIKQGISELHTLYILKQQLAIISIPQQKLENWLDSKIDNLLIALEHSRVNALSIKPYWCL